MDMERAKDDMRVIYIYILSGTIAGHPFSLVSSAVMFFNNLTINALFSSVFYASIINFTLPHLLNLCFSSKKKSSKFVHFSINCAFLVQNIGSLILLIPPILPFSSVDSWFGF